MKSDYDRAVADAKLLKKALGSGWVEVVHENLGWHYYACHTRTMATAHVHSPSHVWMQVIVKQCGQVHVTEKTPQAALEALVKRLHEISVAVLATAGGLHEHG